MPSWTQGFRLAAVVAVLLAPRPGLAETAVRSDYTALDLEGPDCSPLARGGAEDGALACLGLQDYMLELTPGPQAGSGRFAAVVFVNVEGLPELTRFLPVSPVAEAAPGKTVEWLLEKRPGEPEDLAWRPFAAILRFHTRPAAAGEGEVTAGQVLTVVRVTPGETCAVAHVDARANTDANALARRAALERARDFRCGQDRAQPYGARGRSF